MRNNASSSPVEESPAGSLDANQLLQRFASCLVHNVNNPMAAILGCAQILERLLQRPDTLDPSQCLSYVEMIQEESLKCTRMLDSLAFLARPPQPRCALVDAHDIFASALALFYRPESIRIVTEQDAVPSVVAADPGLLTQALLNLLDNAADAMPEGGTITLRTANISAGGDWLRLIVSDTGPGIPPEDLPHATEPFFTTRQGQNGIGLTVCRQLVTRQGGRLCLLSPAAGGTQAMIELPQGAAPT